ncbi:PREDICTED: probable protein phosphatase 2C 60 [Amphimedon queenslandica]|uniref:protein-serine/threonine phosphatase n=1 Tax=Amphimedon queenslandica TaxID=400682 RepID=A0A1X7VQG7_AMPQE|nr:PREDICTED: probable protein phosphatase 2C 60 [Amphimedon queenslandica]|eukprot:XP_003383191.1 PREDICTED: probable protein phosphatase 2C 60 [Amphimedon queenslandica]
MGGFLTKPITDKTVTNGTIGVSDKECQYGTATMQGWRENMEDVITVVTDFDDKCSFLGVFDGHGGKEVSVYCSRHLPGFLKASVGYQDGDVSRGFCEAYMNCDRKLLTEDALKEMKLINESEINEGEEELNGEESGDEVERLTEEAHMPLDKVLQACIEDKKLLKYLINVANRNNGDGSNDDEISSSDGEGMASEEGLGGADNIKETQRSRVYSQFIKELSVQYKPALNELQTMMGEDSSEGEEEEEEEEEEEGPGEGETEEEGKPVIANNVRKRKRCDESDEDLKDSKRLKEGRQEMGQALGEGGGARGEGEGAKEEGDGDEYHDSEGHESGSTATVCLIKTNILYVANAGDSRCVLSSNGEAVDLSLDHKPIDPLERERIERAGGHIDEDLRVNGGLNMSRAIGDHMYKTNETLPLKDQMISAYPDVHTRLLQTQDQFLVLASDGIWNCLDSQQVVDFINAKLLEVRNSKKDLVLSHICEELCDACLAEDIDNDGTGCDNMSIIITLLKPFDKLFNERDLQQQ